MNANLSRDSVLGKVDLQAVVPMSGDAKAELNGSLNQVSLRDLATTVGLQEFSVAGEGQLNLSASAAVRDLGQPNRWTAIGTIQTNGVTLNGLPTIGVVAEWRLDQGIIEVKELLVSRFDHRLRVDASIELTRPWNWFAEIPRQAMAVSPRFFNALDLTSAPALTGTIQISGSVRGNLLTPMVKGELSLSGKSLESEWGQIREIATSLEVNSDLVNLRIQSAQLQGAKLVGNAEARITTANLIDAPHVQLIPKSAELEVKGLALERVGHMWGTVPVSGRANLNISVSADDTASWNWTDWNITATRNGLKLGLTRLSLAIRTCY